MSWGVVAAVPVALAVLAGLVWLYRHRIAKRRCPNDHPMTYKEWRQKLCPNCGSFGPRNSA